MAEGLHAVLLQHNLLLVLLMETLDALVLHLLLTLPKETKSAYLILLLAEWQTLEEIRG